MVTTAGFFTTSLKQSNGQTQAQEAAVLADEQLDYTRGVSAVPGPGVVYLLSGRTQSAVASAISNAPVGVDLTQDDQTSGNYDTSTPPAGTTAVPLSMTTTLNGTKYTIATFIDRCYVTTATTNRTCTPTDTGNGWMYRISVDVTYQLEGGRSCANGKAC